MYNNGDIFTPMNHPILIFLDVAVMILLIISVSMQNKSSGLSNVFGGAGNIVQTRRGFEKWLFYATIVLGLMFVGINLMLVLLK